MPQLYSKLAASQELRKMLNIVRTEDRNDLADLSDAELIQQLSDMAKQILHASSRMDIRIGVVKHRNIR